MSSLLLWLDMEMSGLDPAKERILEIATIVTTAELDVVAEGPELVIHQSDEVLAAMDAWNTEHHGASGLTDKVRASTVTDEDAEAQTLLFVAAHFGAK
ncbi:MAG TPA: oligoribonuclease, partial [Kofleriaceae bacterium]|nr:oligoribonuclease [Kofleriaceae bacterium]